MVNFIETIQTYFYSILASIVILLVGFGLGILVKKFLLKFLKEISLNKIMARIGITRNLEYWVSSIASYLIYLITVVLALEQLGITSIIIYLISGAILMLVLLTFLVGLKDVIPNFVAWFVLQKKGKIKVGRRIDIREISGSVEKVGFLETEIKTDKDDILYVPNSLFLKSKFRIRNN